MPYTDKFSALSRLYSAKGADKIKQSHVCVVGIGGVGSWAAEALIRSGVNTLSLIDLDDISISNTNRQIHALNSSIGGAKVEVMRSRLLDINEEAKVHCIEDFITEENVYDLINSDFDVVIDATDSVKAKAAMVACCKRKKIKIICIGGAGGQINPLEIKKADLAKTIQDPLLAKVRSELRRNYNFSKNLKRNFGVACIYSTEQLVYPLENGEVSHTKTQSQGASKMDCATGFGSFVGVTASFAMAAVSETLSYIVKKT
jgi:tRNA A37 threonylcarbamoyladenosine dehydratase